MNWTETGCDRWVSALIQLALAQPDACSVEDTQRALHASLELSLHTTEAQVRSMLVVRPSTSGTGGDERREILPALIQSALLLQPRRSRSLEYLLEVSALGPRFSDSHRCSPT